MEVTDVECMPYWTFSTHLEEEKETIFVYIYMYNLRYTVPVYT